MADKRIDQLTAATSLTAADLMVTEQSGVAKKVTGNILANSAWNMMQKDASPTKDSTAPVTSGAVYDALGGVFSPTKLATPGALVHIEDGAYNQPVQGMKIAINPVQNLHGYDNPWPGGGGKNLLYANAKNETVNGLTFTVNDDGSFVVNGTAAANTALTVQTGAIAPRKVYSGETYTLSGGHWSNTSVAYIQITYKGDTSGDTFSIVSTSAPETFTFTENATLGNIYINFRLGKTFTNDLVKPQFEKGSTATTFEPYENICPISGWTAANVSRMGRNLAINTSFRNETVSGVTYTINPDGTYHCAGTITGRNACYLLWTDRKIYKPGTYVVSCDNGVSASGIRFVCAYFQKPNTSLRYAEITSPTQRITITIEDGGYIQSLYLRGQTSGTAVDVTVNPMLQLAEDTDQSYAPYQGKTYSVSFSSAGTVYGGILTNNGDGTWTLTVDRAMYTLMPSLSWSVSTGSGFIQFFATLSGMKNSLTAISNKFQPMQLSERPTKTGMVRYNDSVIRFSLTTADSSAMGISNLGEWQTWINNNNVQIVYDLATPLTYTLTAPEVTTLLGINNIWADTGDIEELAYRADIGLYLVEALNPIKEMLGYREDTMKATRAYSTGDYIVVGDTFYRAATAIANGATLTPGTNVNATTVGAQLKLLS